MKAGNADNLCSVCPANNNTYVLLLHNGSFILGWINKDCPHFLISFHRNVFPIIRRYVATCYYIATNYCVHTAPPVAFHMFTDSVKLIQVNSFSKMLPA